MRTFSHEDEETLRRLHADGLSRNEIARQMGWSVGTITGHAQRLGLSFDRAATLVAVEARQIDLKERRQRAQERLMDHFDRMLDRAQGEYLTQSWSHTGEFVFQLIPEPPAKETRDLTLSATAAMTQALKLADVDSGDTGRDEAQGLLRGLGEAMTAAADALAQDMGIGDAAEYGG